MKTKSRALALFLCLMLLVGLLPSTVLAADEPEAASFEDVQEGSWYYEDVDYVSSAGLMTGTSEDTFSPELAVTRGMFVTVLHRMEDEPEAEAAAFEDVDAEAYYAAAVAWAAENGIVTGYSDVMFGPTDTITREKAVTILYRYAIYKGLDAVTTEENLGTFSDEADISDWAIAAVNWAVGEGIVEGMTSNRFNPATLTTRAHVATLLHRYLDEDARVSNAADTGTDGSGSSSGSSGSSSSSSGSHSSGSRYYADNVLESVYALGFVDADGSKLSAIAVEYSVEIAASSVELADFEIQDYGIMMEPSVELGSDPGVALNVYVSATPEIDPNGVGVESGNYVIIEVNTDYQLASVCSPYAVSMAAGVKQAGTLKTTGGRTVSAGTKFVINYTTETTTNRDGSTSEYYPAIDGTYFIYGIMDKYELFTQEDGTAFHATDCFDEATGELSELDLPYALYVPEDYSEDGKYMLVLHIEDAGFLGTDPMIALCESQAPANFASDEMQAYAEQQGYDGIIVVIPQIWSDIRTTRDNYTISSGVDATWQLMDYITDTYTAIDANRIYATGQSMGGMQVIAMAAQRDNYFAGILEMGCQWGTNYSKEPPYKNEVYYNIYDTEDSMITYELAENWFYAVSDDNILVTNCAGDAFSTSVWSEFAYLYYDIAGVEIPYATVSPLEQTDEEMSAVVEALVAQENETGIYWLSYTGGSHMLTWVYGHKIDASYYWLLSQTKESEDSRGKLEALNNAFVHMDAVEASEYIAGDFARLPNGYDRLIATEDSTGISYFYAIPANGAGTDGYNSAWMDMNGGTPSAGAGWNANTVYTVDSILITDGALTVAATLDANADYTVEVYAVAIGENEAELVASGILSSGADTFTSDALTAFAEDVIYTVVISDAGVVVASAMHLTLGEDSGEDENLVLLFSQAGDFDPTSDTNDGIYIAEITDQYFDGGVVVGMEALLNAGEVYLNGIQIPATEETYYMNGMPAIWEKEDGVWTWQAHDKLNADDESKIDHNGDYSFEFARRRFVLAVSALRGMTVDVYAREGEEYACRVEFTIKSGGQVEQIIVNDDDTTTVWGVPIDESSYNTDGGPNDQEPRTLPTANFDQSIEEGDTVLYWYDTEGWHMERAVPVQGLMNASDHFNIVVNGTTYSDALIVRYNMQAGSRPSQFISAANNLELNDIPVTLWNTETGYVIGISRMEYARTALEMAIAFLDGELDGLQIVVSEDGTDVAGDTYWVTQSVMDTYTNAYDSAVALLDNETATNAQIDAAIQVLGSAYGNGSRGLSTMALGTADDSENNTAEIVSVYALGFVDTDGAKVEAIAVEYSADMSGADVSVDSYELELNSDSTGATAVYVNDTAAISETGGSGTGKYVIIEVDTDFLMSSEQTFTSSLAVGVTQTADISAGSVTAAASETAVTNYEETQTYDSYRDTWTTTKAAIYGQYEISGIEGFQFFTSNEDYGTPDGEPYHVEDCFDEKDGLSYDIDVAYALYVPEDYDASGSYAMVVVDNPATTEGTHPLVSVLETRSPALLASDWAQDLVKEQGLDGLIVVVPVVTARVDDNACTPAQYEALLALWDHIQDEYSIDENHVYGIGQSVGGMVLMETNRNRDNYFAAILMFENQWAQNYYKDTLFVRNQASSEETAATAPMHYPRTDAEVTWDYYFDEDGNKVYEDHDPYNLYYLISDDNIIVMNRSSNNLSNNTWQELSYLYTDLVGSGITHFTLDGNAEIAEQEAAINEYLAEDASGLGLHWVTFENGTNGYSARKVLSGYEWLLSQTREDEMSRSKLDLNKPFELADEQIQTEARATSYTDTEGNTLYYLTGKAGAGTQFYNTSWLNLTTIADAAPGWLPEGMSWETGVEAAKIQSVTSIHDENGVLTAVAVEYDVDMTDAVIRLKGDEIIGLDGEVREDITIVLDPYDFYDAAGEQIECTISNVYINDSAAITADAERGSGTGCYVIVEPDTDSTTDSVSLVQRMTIRTNTAIASATATVYSEVDGGNVEDTLRFDAASYEIKNYDYEGETIQVRFYENVQYCANPNAPDLQVMNIYVREDMADDYTAPIFLVQRTGQMKESAASTIETDGNGNLTSMLAMLADGYVVVSPGAR
ncbi:MAG: S-layer homology domain-containing protein, partial [Oscillospiraceae bacterium]|nr:S-layer homology domain-containing protein [Oscillospiraceae bacterium]